MGEQGFAISPTPARSASSQLPGTVIRFPGPTLEAPDYERRRARVILGAILLLAAGLLFWRLPGNGWSNAYYSGAVRAATQSWSAFLTGSLDLSGTISVDKTPLSIWMMALSARIFGFTPAALLIPNALCGLASVGLLYSLARRALGTAVGLLSAFFLAITPALVAVARFNNPDALLVLLLLASAFAATRVLETGRTRYAILCGALVGLAFNTKMLQAYLVLPAFVLALFVTRRERRLQLKLLVAAAATLLVVSLAWIGPLSMLPVQSRPWVADTTTNSWWQLVVGANGVGRISQGVLTGSSAAAATDPGRIIEGPTGGQIAWLLPLALAGAAMTLITLRRRRGDETTRAALVLWVAWAGVHLVVFSVLSLFHPYYTSALAPAVAVLAAFGARALWERRTRTPYLVTGLIVLGVSVALAVSLLSAAPHFLPWLSGALIGSGVLGGGLVAAHARGRRRAGPAAIAAASLLIAVAAGPLSYSWAATERHIGGIEPVAAPGAYGEPAWSSQHDPGRARLLAWLAAHRRGARYLAAVSGAIAGSPIALATRAPVLIMGGFAGSDPAPGVSHLAALVRRGEVRAIVLTSTPAGFAGATSRGLGGAGRRASWVRAHCGAPALTTRLPALVGSLQAFVYECGPATGPPGG